MTKTIILFFKKNYNVKLDFFKFKTKKESCFANNSLKYFIENN